MATALVVRFPWGRYHATPWGRHVNEGQVEIPPSPWRLLRALYAVWKTRAPDLDEATMQSMLARLAEPPTYFVPAYRIAHTRHYYPDSKHRSSAPSTDRTLDAFAVMQCGAELAVRWPFGLEGEEAKALARLAESLPYLGRADSLCEGRFDDSWEPTDEHSVASPLDVGESISPDVEVVTLLTPALPLDPDSLVARPVDVRKGRLLFPPGTRFVAYHQPSGRHSIQQPRRRHFKPVHAVRFTVTERTLPPASFAVAITDRLRGAAVGKLNRVRNHQSERSLLAGRDEQRVRLKGHQHAHYLALPDDLRRVAEVAVWVPGGLDEKELLALSKVTHLWAPEGMPGPGALEIRMAGYGDATQVLDDLTGPARTWESVTPFVPPGHHKKRRDWETFVQRQVLRELEHRSTPQRPLQAREVSTFDGDWRSYLRFRPSKRFARAYDGVRAELDAPTKPDLRTAPPGAFVRITFDEAVDGPLALGHLSHFGLGLFRPVSRA